MIMSITPDALSVIKALTDPERGGLRISAASSASLNGSGPALTVEPAPGPQPDDARIEAEGAELYLDAPALRLLDGKVLDAEGEQDGVRCSVFEPG